jgi:hypothetical protein
VIGPAKRKMRHTLHGEQSAEILYVTEPHQSLFRTAVMWDQYLSWIAKRSKVTPEVSEKAAFYSVR